MNPLHSVLRRRRGWLALGGVAMATASAVLLWRAASIESIVGAASPPSIGSAVINERAAATGRAPLDQDLLRRVDRAASAAGVRVASANVRSVRGRPDSTGSARL